MRKSILVASGFVAGIALMVACSDEVTKVTNVSENASVDSVKEFEALPKCEEDVEGTLIYVKDSAKVYGCTSDGWIQVNGKDGDKGAEGDKGANVNLVFEPAWDQSMMSEEARVELGFD